jgi:dienelactone hydrolase
MKRITPGIVLAIIGWMTMYAAAQASDRTQLTIPTPTGPYAVGTVPLHLVDYSRYDPNWGVPHPRELMISLWYPAVGAVRRTEAPWMSSGLLSYYRLDLEEALSRTLPGPGACPPGTPPENCPPPPPPPASSSDPVSLATVDFPVTHAAIGVPVDLSGGRKHPVVLFTPARGEMREQGTALAEDLASHGYIVVTFGSTYEAFGVEFPGGRIELECGRDPRPEFADCSSTHYPPNQELKLRRIDAQFVLDQLEALARGANPDAEHRALPPGLRAGLDLNRIGIFGHSLGGAVAAAAMANDRRFDAGLNLDGGVSSILEDIYSVPPPELSPEEQRAFEESVLAATASLATRLSEGNRPFMTMASPFGVPPVENPNLIGGGRDFTFHNNLSGFRPHLIVAGTRHGSFTDAMWMYPQLATAGLIPMQAVGRQSVESAVGTINSEHAVALNRAYIHAFFDRTLKGIDNHLLDGPSAEYPEVTVYY